ncbi:hypothetical protein [Tissierella praeacuta]|uniref:hypothetical protein n=1 Tax=Tissierella praeacuta TaxID=43131 RepID=UPI0028AE4681|nr:hypothetical protein [Tissierella praeacuta]
MGLLWGWVAYTTKSIKIVTIAHIITNFFAFTGMILRIGSFDYMAHYLSFVHKAYYMHFIIKINLKYR